MRIYHVEPSHYIRGVAIVTPHDDETRALCADLSRGKFSPRERGYRMDGRTLRRFMRAAARQQKAG